MVELTSLVNQDVRNTVADHHRTQGLVSRGNALRQAHQVRPEAKALVAEPVTQPAEAADDFISNEQNAVVIADALDLGPVGLRRNDDATRALDGLADEGGHVLLAQLLDLLLKAPRGLDAV